MKRHFWINLSKVYLEKDIDETSHSWQISPTRADGATATT